ncbi:MAG: response regulator [Planctomycetes bacterium]|nr:response regulator [Planctomycetota bacterium]
MHLLVVEDEDAIRHALTRGLATLGVTVSAAASLGEARELVAAKRPDALVSDLKLPDGTGLDLARELGVPFVLMTGYGTFDDAVAALRLGCIDFFTKPVPMRDLRHAVDRIRGRLHAGPTVVEAPAEAVVVASPGEGDAVVRLGAAGWTTPDDARAAWSRLQTLAPAASHRQVLAECLQAVGSGRAVVNLRDDRWLLRMRSECGVSWTDEVKRVVEDCASSVHWSSDGCFVECVHGD